MFDNGFWRGKRVLVTGHSGFKGSWLCLWLEQLGAEVYGYALEPPTDPNLFSLAAVETSIDSTLADIRDAKSLQAVFDRARPEIVFHLAAQALVQESYLDPVETYSVNVMGTVQLLEAVRHSGQVRAVVNVTSDKCYENKEWLWGYREEDRLGGFDPYSNSKGCAEMVTAAFRNSFFSAETYTSVASARAGNVIGGGDWGKYRLVCDCLRALWAGEEIVIRNPSAIRPWQHVLEPLAGYLLLAEKLYSGEQCWRQAWNFGPNEGGAKPVEWLVERLCSYWGDGASYRVENCSLPHEATYLKLDSSKARTLLGWQPRWDIEETLARCVEWGKRYQQGEDVRAICLSQLKDYMS